MLIFSPSNEYIYMNRVCIILTENPLKLLLQWIAVLLLDSTLACNEESLEMQYRFLLVLLGRPELGVFALIRVDLLGLSCNLLGDFLLLGLLRVDEHSEESFVFLVEEPLDRDDSLSTVVFEEIVHLHIVDVEPVIGFHYSVFYLIAHDDDLRA